MTTSPPGTYGMGPWGGPRGHHQDESIYGVQAGYEASPPVVRTYMVEQPASSSRSPQADCPVLAPVGYNTRQHVDSSQVATLLAPPPPPPPPQPVRPAVRAPNHQRSNVAAIKEQSALNALRRQAEAMAQADAARPRAIKAMPHAKVTDAPIAVTSPAAASPSPASAGAYGGTPGSGHTSTPGGGGAQAQQQQHPPRRDFVKENRVVAPVRAARPSPPLDDGLKYRNKPDFGRVPTYLLNRKMELLDQKEAELRAQEMAHVPPGMRQLSEEERLETLAVLQKNRAELEHAVQGLPLRIETPSQMRRRDALEERIKEVEEGIKAFSRARVLVKL